MKISIIVPVHNVASCLQDCLDSLANQAFSPSDYEVVLVDDGSTDASLTVCEAMAHRDSRFRVFHKANGGVSSARNRGLDEARGDWILFVDADDWLDPDYLSAFMESPDLNPDTLLFQGYKKVFSDKTFIRSLKPFPTQKETIAKNDLLAYWGICGKLYNRQIIEKLSLRFDESFALGEDGIFFFTYLAEVSALAVLPQVGYNYRDSAVSLSKKVTPWNLHYTGSVALCERTLPVVKRLAAGAFFYRKRFENLLLFEQHALRLETLYRDDVSISERKASLRKAFGNRWALLKIAYPLFSKKWKYGLLWGMFLTLPIPCVDKLLASFFKSQKQHH